MQTKFENDWNCPNCEELQSKHNMSLGEAGICENCFIAEISAEEKTKIETFKHNFKREVRLDRISGGFVTIKSITPTANEIELLISYGVTNDISKDVNEYIALLDRETFKEVDYGN